MEEVSFLVDIVEIVEDNDVQHICLMKVQRVEYLSWVWRKLITLIFLGLKIFFQVFLIKILMLEENLSFSGQVIFFLGKFYGE